MLMIAEQAQPPEGLKRLLGELCRVLTEELGRPESDEAVARLKQAIASDSLESYRDVIDWLQQRSVEANSPPSV